MHTLLLCVFRNFHTSQRLVLVDLHFWCCTIKSTKRLESTNVITCMHIQCQSKLQRSREHNTRIKVKIVIVFNVRTKMETRVRVCGMCFGGAQLTTFLKTFDLLKNNFCFPTHHAQVCPPRNKRRKTAKMRERINQLIPMRLKVCTTCSIPRSTGKQCKWSLIKAMETQIRFALRNLLLRQTFMENKLH